MTRRLAGMLMVYPKGPRAFLEHLPRRALCRQHKGQAKWDVSFSQIVRVTWGAGCALAVRRPKPAHPDVIVCHILFSKMCSHCDRYDVLLQKLTDEKTRRRSDVANIQKDMVDVCTYNVVIFVTMPHERWPERWLQRQL